MSVTYAKPSPYLITPPQTSPLTCLDPSSAIPSFFHPTSHPTSPLTIPTHIPRTQQPKSPTKPTIPLITTSPPSTPQHLTPDHPPQPKNMSMNDVNLAPANAGNPIKGATQGADTQALGGGKVAGMSPLPFPFLFCHHLYCSCCDACFSVSPTHPTSPLATPLMIFNGVIDPPSTGDGTGSSGESRKEELKGKVPGMEERERVEQGKT